MAKRKRVREMEPTDADLILESTQEATLLDMIDKLLDKGVVAHGDVVLGVAGVDLVYVRLAALLSAIDRVFPEYSGPKRRHNRAPRRFRAPKA